jgi:hypothetical protein
MSFYRIKNHPFLDGILGFFATRSALNGDLRGVLIETHRVAEALDEHQQTKLAGCTEVARDAAITDAENGGDVEHAKAAAVSAGMTCMGKGPLLTGTIRPAPSGPNNLAPVLTQPRGFTAGVVFTLAAVIGGVIAYAVVRGLLQ